eukprot:g13481.t1
MAKRLSRKNTDEVVGASLKKNKIDNNHMTTELAKTKYYNSMKSAKAVESYVKIEPAFDPYRLDAGAGLLAEADEKVRSDSFSGWMLQKLVPITCKCDTVWQKVVAKATPIFQVVDTVASLGNFLGNMAKMFIQVEVKRNANEELSPKMEDRGNDLKCLAMTGMQAVFDKNNATWDSMKSMYKNNKDLGKFPPTKRLEEEMAKGAPAMQTMVKELATNLSRNALEDTFVKAMKMIDAEVEREGGETLKNKLKGLAGGDVSVALTAEQKDAVTAQYVMELLGWESLTDEAALGVAGILLAAGCSRLETVDKVQVLVLEAKAASPDFWALNLKAADVVEPFVGTKVYAKQMAWLSDSRKKQRESLIQKLEAATRDGTWGSVLSEMTVPAEVKPLYDLAEVLAKLRPTHTLPKTLKTLVDRVNKLDCVPDTYANERCVVVFDRMFNTTCVDIESFVRLGNHASASELLDKLTVLSPLNMERVKGLAIAVTDLKKGGAPAVKQNAGC